MLLWRVKRYYIFCCIPHSHANTMLRQLQPLLLSSTHSCWAAAAAAQQHGLHTTAWTAVAEAATAAAAVPHVQDALDALRKRMAQGEFVY